MRSVNRVVICGVVTRMMTNAKKPISAAVTATMRHQPRRTQTSQESNKTLHQLPPGIRPKGPTGQLLPRGWFRYG